jgi:hypothetical protein
MSNSVTLEALRRYPDYQQLIFDLSTSQSLPEWYQHSWINSHGPELFQLIRHVQQEIAEQITRMTMETMHQVAKPESKSE